MRYVVSFKGKKGLFTCYLLPKIRLFVWLQFCFKDIKAMLVVSLSNMYYRCPTQTPWPWDFCAPILGLVTLMNHVSASSGICLGRDCPINQPQSCSLTRPLGVKHPAPTLTGTQTRSRSSAVEENGALGSEKVRQAMLYYWLCHVAKLVQLSASRSRATAAQSRWSPNLL